MEHWVLYAVIGGAAGLVNGFFGAGGGILLVPLLLHAGRLEDRKAFATSLSVMLPLALVSLVMHRLQGHGLPDTAAFYVAGGAVGGLLGGKFFRKLPVRTLHLLFGGLILWGGLRILWKFFL